MPNNRTITSVIDPVSVADANEGPGKVVDIFGKEKDIEFILNARNTAGSSPTLDVKLQHGSIANAEYYTTNDTEQDVELREGATTNVRIGASFSKSGAAAIYKASLRLKKNGTVSTTNLTLAIQADSSGPDGTDLATATLSTDDIGTSYAYNDFTFETPADLSDSTTYWLVLTSDYTASATNNIAWACNSGLSSGGNQSIHNGTSWSADVDDSQQFKLQEVAFADTGDAFTQVTDSAVATETISVDAKKYDRYVRAHTTVTGTSTPAFATSLTMVSQDYI